MRTSTLSRLVVAAVIAVTLTTSSVAEACGTNPFVGEICTFAFDFCPQDFAPTDGRLMAIRANTALFSILGTMYGGDGRTTFALPDLRGRTAVGRGGFASPGEVAGDAATVKLHIDTSPRGITVPATQSPFVGLTRCIALRGTFPPRP